MLKDINDILKEFIGKKCFRVVVGESSGSIISLQFGKKIVLSDNKNRIPPEERYDPEYSIMIFSSWKLLRKNEVICDSISLKDKASYSTLMSLVDQKICLIKFLENEHSLSINFNNEHLLICKADGYEQYGDEWDNYIVFIPGYSYSFTTKLTIVEEERNHLE